MLNFSSCPSTSSSSNDPGTEEHISLNPSSNLALGIPGHPLWKEFTIPRQKTFSKNTPESGSVDEWVNPFKPEAKRNRRALELPLLEKNSEGKFIVASKRKSVRFSSPLTDQPALKKKAVFKMEQLFTALSDDIISDNSSSFYDSLPRPQVGGVPISKENTLFEEKPVNYYLSYYDEPVGEAQELKSDLNSLDNNGKTLKVKPSKEQIEPSSYYEVEQVVTAQSKQVSSPSCDTPLFDIFKEEMYGGEHTSSNLVETLKKSLQDLAEMGNSNSDPPYIVNIDEFTTIGYIFEVFEVLVSRLKTNFNDLKDGQNEYNLLQETVSKLKQDLVSKETRLKERNVIYSSDLATLQKEIQGKSLEIFKLTGALEYEKNQNSKLAEERDATKEELQELSSMNTKMEMAIDTHIQDMQIELDCDFENCEEKLACLANLLEAVEKLAKSEREGKLEQLKLKEKLYSEGRYYKDKILYLEQTFRVLESQYEKSVTTNEVLEEELNMQHNNVLELKGQLQNTQIESIEYKKDSENLKSEIESKTKTLVSIESMNIELQKEISALQNQNQLLVEEMRKIREVWQQPTEELREQLRIASENKRNLEQQFKELTTSLIAYEQQIENLSNRNEIMEKEKLDFSTRMEVMGSALSIKEDAINLSKEKISFLELKLESISDTLTEKLNYISTFEEIKLELESQITMESQRGKKLLSAANNNQEMIVTSYKELLDSITIPFSEVLTDEYTSQIPESFGKATKSRSSEVMIPYLSKTNKVVLEAIEFIVMNLKKYSKALTTERLNISNLEEQIKIKDVEIKKLKATNLLSSSAQLNKQRRNSQDKRRVVSDRVYHNTLPRRHSQSCVACKSNGVGKQHIKSSHGKVTFEGSPSTEDK